MKHPSEQYEEETGKYHYNSSKIDFEYSCDYVDWLEQKYMNQAKNNEDLDLVSNRISDEEIKRYRKEGRLSGATKREPFYKLIAQRFDKNYEDTDFDILYDC